MALDRDGLIAKMLGEFVLIRRSEDMEPKERAALLGLNLDELLELEKTDSDRVHARVTARKLSAWVGAFVQELKTMDDSATDKQRDRDRFGVRGSA